ncbi:MAG: DNA repair protein RecO [Patescibacteria group bacterium]
MEETFNTKAIILRREPFRESDTKVTVYSLEKGKLHLVARGTKKINSKLAGHLEPMNLVDLMIVRGKQFDYAGSAKAINCFGNAKNDLEKNLHAGSILQAIDRMIDIGEKDEKIFSLLSESFLKLDDPGIPSHGLLPAWFFLRLISLSGYRPDLYSCAACRDRLKPGNNFFNYERNGLVCGKCAVFRGLKVSDDCIKVLRLMLEEDFDYLIKLKINDKLSVEIKEAINSFLQNRH